jgi:hypothetical protein
MYRKLVLTAFVLFIDTEQGYNKLSRLSIASLLCIFAFALVAMIRPFRREIDDALVNIAFLALSICFVSGITIKICANSSALTLTSGDSLCNAQVGWDSDFQASLVVVCISAVMLPVVLLVLAHQLRKHGNLPLLRWSADNTQVVPRALEAPVRFHAFVSHNWATGQDQARSLKELLKGLAPGLQIFLDVDDGWWRPKAKGEKAQRKPPADLAESYKLKARHSAALIVVLTGEFGEGGVARSSYFESKYCVMEYRGALAAGKPIVFVLEVDPAHGGIPMQTHLDELGSAQGDHWKNEDGSDDTVARNLLRQHWDAGMVVPWQRVHS